MFIMILLVTTITMEGASSVVISQEMGSEKACEKAATTVTQVFSKSDEAHATKVTKVATATCVWRNHARK